MIAAVNASGLCQEKATLSPKSSGLAVYIEQTWATVDARRTVVAHRCCCLVIVAFEDAMQGLPASMPKREAFNILQNVPPVVAQWSTLSGDIHADKYEQQSIGAVLLNV